MKFEKIKLINSENYSEYVNFSEKVYFNEVNSSDNDSINEEFALLDTIWVVHELEDLKLIKKTALGSMVVAIIRGESVMTGYFEMPYDLKDDFLKNRINIVFGGDVEEQSALCSSLIDIDKFIGWKPFFRDNSIENNISYFKLFYRSLGAKLNVKNLYKNTSIHTTHIFLRNALINAPLVHDGISITSFFGALQNKPILIVAAGPSLNKQLPLLAEYQQYFNILSVDTVWPILDRYGIKPDLVFALDSRSKPSWPRNCVADETCFSVDIGCAPNLVWSHDQNHLFSSTSEQIRALLETLGVQVDVLATGGSVATSAFNFARSLGGNPIILIGQDLALTGGKDHADGYLHVYSDELLKARADSGFDVEGYYGDRVKTETQLLYYKTWYEEQVKDFPDVMVINSTEGGAKIKGCLQIPFEAVCVELKKSNLSKNFIFKKYKMEFNAQHLSRLNKNIDDLIKAVEGFIDLAHRGELIIDAKGKKSTSKLLKKIDGLNDELMAYDNGARFVIDAFSQLKMETIRFNTVVDKTEKTIHKAIYKYKEIYEGIQESGHQALAMLSQIQALYRRLAERESYDLDLLDEIFTSNRHS